MVTVEPSAVAPSPETVGTVAVERDGGLARGVPGLVGEGGQVGVVLVVGQGVVDVGRDVARSSTGVAAVRSCHRRWPCRTRRGHRGQGSGECGGQDGVGSADRHEGVLSLVRSVVMGVVAGSGARADVGRGAARVRPAGRAAARPARWRTWRCGRAGARPARAGGRRTRARSPRRSWSRRPRGRRWRRCDVRPARRAVACEPTASGASSSQTRPVSRVTRASSSRSVVRWYRDRRTGVSTGAGGAPASARRAETKPRATPRWPASSCGCRSFTVVPRPARVFTSTKQDAGVDVGPRADLEPTTAARRRQADSVEVRGVEVGGVVGERARPRRSPARGPAGARRAAPRARRGSARTCGRGASAARRCRSARRG